MGMKVITAPILSALTVAFNKAFSDGLAMAPSDWTKVASEIKSTGQTNLYGWLSKIPGIREWIGERRFNTLKTNGYSLTNRLFESSVGVMRTDIEDDAVGMYAPLFNELGRVANEHIDKEIFGKLKNGHLPTVTDDEGNVVSNLCFDGQSFFDTDHPIFGVRDGAVVTLGVQSNLIAGSETHAWYLLDNSRALKPLVYQNRLDAKLTSMDSESDEGTFMRDEYRHGVRARRAFGYGLPQMAIKSNAPLTAANLQAARVMMQNMVTDENRKLGIKPCLLVVPFELEATANLIVKAEVIDGTTNTNRNTVEVLATPWLN